MFIEFDNDLVNMDYIKIIFINDYTMGKDKSGQFIYTYVVEMHFHDSIEYRYDFLSKENLDSLKFKYECFSSEEERDKRFEELKKLLILKNI